jgi:hypothetical protein
MAYAPISRMRPNPKRNDTKITSKAHRAREDIYTQSPHPGTKQEAIKTSTQNDTQTDESLTIHLPL